MYNTYRNLYATQKTNKLLFIHVLSIETLLLALDVFLQISCLKFKVYTTKKIYVYVFKVWDNQNFLLRESTCPGEKTM